MLIMKIATHLYQYGGIIRMPGGFKVTVVLLDKEEAKDTLGSQVLAAYWQEDHVITLKKSRSARQRKTDLEHELQHMTVDWIDHFIRKARCRK